MRVLVMLLCPFLLVSACHPNSIKVGVDASPSRGGGIEEKLEGWQTYAQTRGKHVYEPEGDVYSVERVLSHTTLRSGIGYVEDGRLMVLDYANKLGYELDAGELVPAAVFGDYYRFRAGNWEFNFDPYQAEFSACSKGTETCSFIEVAKNSFPFVYAEAGGSVLAITNWGEAVRFDGEAWCRMAKSGETWSCPKREQPVLSEARGEQFYISVLFEGQTYVGHWPTGVLYHFDGETLKPDRRMTPEPIWQLRSKKLGYEAQSMSIYCGDLFVGYWPRGEIWRFDRENSEWEFFTRLFSGGEEYPLIPHLWREPDGLEGAFFGQRVTSLIPYDDSLYAFTANLNSWTTSVADPSWMTEAEVREYGSIWRIHRPGCITIY